MVNFVGKGTVESHKLVLNDLSVRTLAAQLKEVEDGTELRVEIKKYDAKKEREKLRTEQQNKYYHKLLDIICDYTGDDHISTHSELKAMFLSRPWVRGDKEYILVGSTRDLTSKEFGGYIDKVFQWAATELNLVLPDSSSYI
jgi:hypothetical protein